MSLDFSERHSEEVISKVSFDAQCRCDAISTTHQGLKISTQIYPKTFCVQLMLFLISLAKELGVKLCIYLWAATLLEHNTVHLHHGPTLKYMSGYVLVWVFCYPFLLALVYFIYLFLLFYFLLLFFLFYFFFSFFFSPFLFCILYFFLFLSFIDFFSFFFIYYYFF